MIHQNGIAATEASFETADSSRVSNFEAAFQELRDCRFIRDGRSLEIVGEPCVGKTRLGSAIAKEARSLGFSVDYLWVAESVSLRRTISIEQHAQLLEADLVIFESLDTAVDQRDSWFVRQLLERFDRGRSCMLIGRCTAEQWCPGDILRQAVLNRMRSQWILNQVTQYRLTAPIHRS